MSQLAESVVLDGFDPRPCEGATGGKGDFVWVVWVSIRAPVRGRPLTLRAHAVLDLVSIRAPVRGRRPRSSSLNMRAEGA